MTELELLRRVNEDLKSMSQKDFEKISAKLEKYEKLPKDQRLKHLAELFGYKYETEH